MWPSLRTPVIGEPPLSTCSFIASATEKTGASNEQEERVMNIRNAVFAFAISAALPVGLASLAEAGSAAGLGATAMNAVAGDNLLQRVHRCHPECVSILGRRAHRHLPPGAAGRCRPVMCLEGPSIRERYRLPSIEGRYR